MGDSASTRCPDCGLSLPVVTGLTTWCDGCNWNVVAPAPIYAPRGLRGRLAEAAGQRLGARLAHELATRESLDPRLTPSRAATYAIAGLVLLLTLFFAVGGAALSVWGALDGNPIAIVGGLVPFGIAWFMRPRIGEVPNEGVVGRSDAPALHGLVDRCAEELGLEPIDVLVVDGDWNASYMVVGLRRRRVLTLGLPLFYALAPQQRVALIGHELAHARNGDSTRGLFVGSAIGGLEELYGFVGPEGPEDAEGITLLAKPLLWLVSRPPYWLLRLHVSLVRHDGHRAEYLADALAARVAGTSAVVGLHERTLLHTSFELAVYRATQPAAANGNVFDDLVRSIESVPPREIDRRRRVARLESARLDVSHPPMGMRIDLLEHRPPEAGRVSLSPEVATAIDAELRPHCDHFHRLLVREYESSLYEG